MVLGMLLVLFIFSFPYIKINIQTGLQKAFSIVICVHLTNSLFTHSAFTVWIASLGDQVKI